MIRRLAFLLALTLAATLVNSAGVSPVEAMPAACQARLPWVNQWGHVIGYNGRFGWTSHATVTQEKGNGAFVSTNQGNGTFTLRLSDPTTNEMGCPLTIRYTGYANVINVRYLTRDPEARESCSWYGSIQSTGSGQHGFVDLHVDVEHETYTLDVGSFQLPTQKHACWSAQLIGVGGGTYPIKQAPYYEIRRNVTRTGTDAYTEYWCLAPITSNNASVLPGGPHATSC